MRRRKFLPATSAPQGVVTSPMPMTLPAVGVVTKGVVTSLEPESAQSPEQAAVATALVGMDAPVPIAWFFGLASRSSIFLWRTQGLPGAGTLPVSSLPGLGLCIRPSVFGAWLKAATAGQP